MQNTKQLNRIDVLQRKVEEFNESIESICAIQLCLVEGVSMQIRAEEQDEDDKKGIYLNGKAADHTGADSKQVPAFNGKYPEFPEQVGTTLKVYKDGELP